MITWDYHTPAKRLQLYNRLAHLQLFKGDGELNFKHRLNKILCEQLTTMLIQDASSFTNDNAKCLFTFILSLTTPTDYQIIFSTLTKYELNTLENVEQLTNCIDPIQLLYILKLFYNNQFIFKSELSTFFRYLLKCSSLLLNQSIINWEKIQHVTVTKNLFLREFYNLINSLAQNQIANEDIINNFIEHFVELNKRLNVFQMPASHSNNYSFFNGHYPHLISPDLRFDPSTYYQHDENIAFFPSNDS